MADAALAPIPASTPTASTDATVTTAFKIEEHGKGKYKIIQLKPDPPPRVDEYSGSHRDFDHELVFGIGVHGWVDIYTHEISVDAMIFGHNVGPHFSSRGEEILRMDIDVSVASGVVAVFVQAGWLKVAFQLTAPIVGEQRAEIDLVQLAQ